MTLRVLIPIIMTAWLVCVSEATAGDTLNNVEFQPMFNEASGLELHVQNYTKLPKTLAAIEVFIGGTANRAACRVTVPGITLAPAVRSSVVVADVKTLNSCLPASAPARASHRLQGLENIPLKTGDANHAPLQFGRSVRIVPHFAGVGTTASAPQQLRFRIAD